MLVKSRFPQSKILEVFYLSIACFNYLFNYPYTNYCLLGKAFVLDMFDLLLLFSFDRLRMSCY